jgi:DUF3006 family protein
MVGASRAAEIKAMAHRICHLPIEIHCINSRDTGAGDSAMSKHSRHTWVVDVIEDGSASIEVDGRTVTPIPQWMLPEGVKEGDVLSVTHDRKVGKSALLIETDPEAKKKLLRFEQEGQ